MFLLFMAGFVGLAGVRIAAQYLIHDAQTLALCADALEAARAWLAMLAAWIAWRRFRARTSQTFNPWLSITIGFAAYALGEMMWTYADWRGESPVGSLADFAYYLFYPCITIGMLQLPSSRRSPSERLILLIDMGTILVAAVVLMWTTVVRETIMTYGTLNSASLSSVMYPLGDVLLIWAAFFALLATGDAVSNRVRWPLSFGAIILLVSDLAYAIEVNTNTYLSGNWIGIGWTLGLSIMGVGAALAWEDHIKCQDERPEATLFQLSGSASSLLALICFGISWTVAYLTGNLSNDPTVLAMVLVMLGMVALRQALGVQLISRLHRELTDAHDYLDHRVRERTEELGFANSQLRREIQERQQSEERFRTLAENSRDTIQRLDLEGRHLYANQVVIQIFGIPQESFIGNTIRDLALPAEVCTAFEQAFDATRKSQQPHRTEISLPNQIVLEYVFVLERDAHDQPQAIICTGRDITERKIAEEGQFEAIKRLNDIIEFLPDATFVIDVSGKVIAWNKAIEEMTGIGKAQILGKGNYEYALPFYGKRRPILCDLVLAKTGLPEEKLYYPVLRQAETLYAEAEVPGMRGGQGGIVWCTASILRNAAGAITGAIESIRDITDRKNAEEALRKNEALLRSIGDSLPGGMIYQALANLDGSRSFAYVSAGSLQLHGYPPEAIVSDARLVYAQVHEEDRAPLIAAEEYAMKTLTPFDVEVRFRLPNGEIRWRRLVTQIQRSANGDWVGNGVELDITERKRAEEALRLSEERLASIIQGSPIPAFVINKDHLILYWNRAAEQISGIAAVEMVGTNQHWRAFYDHARPCLADLLMDNALDQIPHYYGTQCWSSTVIEGAYETINYFPLIGPRGRWLHATAAVFRNAAGEVIGAIESYQDITASKRAEDELRLSAERTMLLLALNQMTDASIDEITAFALEASLRMTRSAIGYLAFVNDDETVLTMHAWSKSAMQDCQVINKPIDYAVAETGLWGEAVRQRKPVITNDYAAPSPWKRGMPEGHISVLRHMNIPVFSGSHIVVVAGVGNKPDDYDDTDVHELTLLMEGMWRLIERKRALMAIKESEAKYRDLVENANSIIMRVNDHGLITFFNEYAQALFGYSEDEILGRNVEEMLVSIEHSSSSRLLEIVRSMNVTPYLHETFECENICRGSKKIRVAWTVKVLKNPEKQTLEMLCVGADVTELNRVEAQLRQAQKMEAIGQLAGGVAHDFNNLLQAILGYVELLLPEDEEPAEAPEEILEIKKAAERAAELTRQLLAFSRRQVLAPKPLDLNTVVTDLLKIIRRVIGEHIELRFIAEQSLFTVEADRGQIEQVLMNLCVNARDAMPEGGQLLIQTANERLETALPEGPGPGNYITLSVRDTGCGIDPALLPHVFEPFFTTKGVGQGTGLGLATVYGVVKQHNGLIQVDSALGKGTTFRIYLRAADMQPRHAQEEAPPPAAGGTETILLAEDEDLVRALAVRVLEQAGYTVMAARDGREALKLYEANRNKIDMLVLDVVMPGLGGRAVFEAVRAERPDIPCLFCSGYSADAVHADFILDEGLTLIQKPYHREQLYTQVRRLLDARKAKG